MQGTIPEDIQVTVRNEHRRSVITRTVSIWVDRVEDATALTGPRQQSSSGSWNLESVIGQLYPATLLARIVTLEMRQGGN
jgi:hypothetical protein